MSPKSLFFIVYCHGRPGFLPLLKAPINGMKVRSKRSQVHASRIKLRAKRMKVHEQVFWAEEAEHLRTPSVAVLVVRV